MVHALGLGQTRVFFDALLPCPEQPHFPPSSAQMARMLEARAQHVAALVNSLKPDLIVTQGIQVLMEVRDMLAQHVSTPVMVALSTCPNEDVQQALHQARTQHPDRRIFIQNTTSGGFQAQWTTPC